jgi:AraC family transcriptional regulator of adaptative response / DNA-3-methyladenine glycosylase II
MDLDHDACYRAIEVRDTRFDRRFFTAVETTGTYCRPVCPAQSDVLKGDRSGPAEKSAKEGPDASRARIIAAPSGER